MDGRQPSTTGVTLAETVACHAARLAWPRLTCFAILLLAGLGVAVTGCGPSATEEEGGDTAAPVAKTEKNADLDKPLLEPFDPPTLAELDAQVEWIDQPVEDGIENLRARQANEPLLATPEEALRLRNDSPEDNAKITSALGRLPESDGQVDWDATLVRHFAGDINTTNPILVSSVSDMDLVDLTSAGLFSFDWTFRPYAARDTVVSWQTSSDRMYDKVVMRDDLSWSDGHPFTAGDVVFSFKTILNPRIPIPAVRSGTDRLRWVEAYNDRTLVFFHKEALATNIWNVNFPIIPKHIYTKSIEEDPTLQRSGYHVQQENNPVSSGPYVLVNRVRGQELLLRRRESWYMHEGKQVRDKPYFEEIRIRVIPDANSMLLALKKGEIDEAELNPEQWMTQTKGEDFYESNTKAYGLEWTYFYIGWNMKLPFFEDVRVRKALSHTLDHEEMLENVCYGLYEPCSGVYHPTAWMASPNTQPYHQDLDKAEELLAQAGWEDHDLDGILDKEINGRLVPFEFTLIYRSGSSTAERVATLFRENLDSIGIICNLRSLEFATQITKVREKDFQAFFGGWGTGVDPDLSDNVWTTEAYADGRNYVGFSDPRVDELFELGKREFDREKRAEIYREIHERIYEAQPYTFLFYRSSFYGFNKRLRGYNFSPRGPYGYGPGIAALWKPLP